MVIKLMMITLIMTIITTRLTVKGWKKTFRIRKEIRQDKISPE